MTSLSRPIRAAAFIAVAGLLAIGVLVATPSTASAAPTPAQESSRSARNYYGALAIAADQASAYSFDYRTKRAAKQRAMRKCKNLSDYPRTCTVTGWVRNGCAATAVKINNEGFVWRYSFDFARTLRKAKRGALNKLSRPRKLLVWVCTTRR